MLSRFFPEILPGVDAFKEMLGIAGMLKDPHAIQNIYRIEDGMLGNDATRTMIQHLRADETLAKVVEEGYVRGVPVDIEPLRHMPKGTLGREFARHIDDYNFDIDYYQQIPTGQANPDVQAVLNRVRETHDIWHVVLGFHPTPVGELGLKAFELAQLRRPMAGVIVGGGIMRYTVVGGDQFDEAIAAISAGYRMGLQAKPLLAERWEDQWQTPVEEIRDRLNLKLPSDRELGAEDPKGVQPSHRDEY
ncbi:MAG: Coq4 family protein [Planctomycetota bacterium]